jgi:hypothetical protein
MLYICVIQRVWRCGLLLWMRCATSVFWSPAGRKQQVQMSGFEETVGAAWMRAGVWRWGLLLWMRRGTSLDELLRVGRGESGCSLDEATHALAKERGGEIERSWFLADRQELIGDSQCWNNTMIFLHSHLAVAWTANKNFPEMISHHPWQGTCSALWWELKLPQSILLEHISIFTYLSLANMVLSYVGPSFGVGARYTASRHFSPYIFGGI